jgi:hypothetical protein
VYRLLDHACLSPEFTLAIGSRKRFSFPFKRLHDGVAAEIVTANTKPVTVTAT